MDIKAALREGIKELILPELETMKSDIKGLKAEVGFVSKRLDDVSDNLIDQSRRIDLLHSDINKLREDLTGRIDNVRDELIGRIDYTNKRLDRLYEVVVRREEHFGLSQRMTILEQEMKTLKKKIAA